MRFVCSPFGPSPGFDFLSSERSGSAVDAASRPRLGDVEQRRLRVLVGRAVVVAATSATSGAGWRLARRGRGSPARRRPAARGRAARAGGRRLEPRLRPRRRRALAAHARRGVPDGVARAAEERAERGARQEQDADDRQHDAEDRRAGACRARARRPTRGRRRRRRRGRAEREQQARRASIASPTRNGRTATSSLRVTISAPTGMSTTGARYAAQPIAVVGPRPATGPPFRPNQSTQARKTPSATSASPISSGWWCAGAARAALRRRFLTRAASSDAAWPCASSAP